MDGNLSTLMQNDLLDDSEWKAERQILVEDDWYPENSTYEIVRLRELAGCLWDKLEAISDHRRDDSTIVVFLWWRLSRR